jgi:cytochrome c-type protein NapC
MPDLLKRMRRRWKLMLVLLVGGFFTQVAVGILGAYVLAFTSTEEFCVSCHEMKYNYTEYVGTIHDTNRTGVRAICTNCHVPHEPGPLVFAKIKASADMYYTYISPTIDTKEKFEAKRHELATKVWIKMKANDSETCRSCHRADKMNLELQSPKAQIRHAKGKAEGLTCIECHFAIAHHEPDGPGPRELFAKAAEKSASAP